MGCLGVHFALTEQDVHALRSIEDEQERLSYLQEDIEGRYMIQPKTYAAESDKAWDAMHRALADGHLSWDGGAYPFNHAVLGGELLYTDDDYIMSLKTPDQVKHIAAALDTMTEENLRLRYDAIPAEEYGMPLDNDDFDYTWHWFQVVRDLYRRAALEHRYVLFTADQ